MRLCKALPVAGDAARQLVVVPQVLRVGWAEWCKVWVGTDDMLEGTAYLLSRPALGTASAMSLRYDCSPPGHDARCTAGTAQRSTAQCACRCQRRVRQTAGRSMAHSRAQRGTQQAPTCTTLSTSSRPFHPLGT